MSVAVLDPTALADLLETSGDDAAFMVEMINAYLEDAPGLLGAMRHAASSGNAPALRRAAHTLKSSSSTFGATALADLCRETEDAARRGDLNEAMGCLPAIERAWSETQSALVAARREWQA